MKFAVSYGKAHARAAFDPLDTEAVRAQARALLAHNDLIIPVWAQRQGRDYTEAYGIFREINPDVQLAEYDNMKNWAGGLHELSDIPEEWFLHVPYHSRSKEDRLVRGPIGSGPYQEWAYDIRNGAFLAFKAARAQVAASRGADLIWVDNAGFRGSNDSLALTRYATNTKVVPYDLARGQQFSTASWNEAMLHAAEVYTAELLIPCVANISKRLDPGESQLIAHYGGALTEGHGWFAHRDGPDGYSPEEIRNQLMAVDTGLEAGQTWVIMGKPHRNDVPWPERQHFAYACLLLVDQGPGQLYSMFDYGADNDWGGYDVDLGTPIGEYTEPHPGVFERHYSKGTVTVIANTMTSRIEFEPAAVPDPRLEIYERIEDNLGALQDAFRQLKELP